MAAEDARRSPAGWSRATAAMSRPSWKPGRRHGTHTHRGRRSTPGQRLAVGGGRQRDAGVGVQVVDVRRRRPARASRCRSTGRRRPGRAGSSRTRRPSRPRARRPGRRRPATRSRSSRSTARPGSVSVPRSPPEPLTQSSSTGLAGDRVGRGALGRGVAAGVVGVARVGAEPVAAGDQLDRAARRSVSPRRGTGQAPQPACWPPTRSARIRSTVAGAPRTRPSGRGPGPAPRAARRSSGRTSVL